MAERTPAVEIITLADEAATESHGDAPVIAETADADGLPPGATLHADGTVTLTLQYPVTMRYRTGQDAPLREEVTERLTFHRLKGADMRVINAAPAEGRAVCAIARSVRKGELLMARLFDQMDGADASAAGEVVAYFLGSGRKRTGR